MSNYVENTKLRTDIITGEDDVCRKVAEALGIKHCKLLEIKMSIDAVDAVVSIKAEFYPEKDNVKSLIPILATEIEDVMLNYSNSGSITRTFTNQPCIIKKRRIK